DQGVDWAVYQGAQGKFGYAHDKFSISQIGGYNANGLYDQWTYKSQVASTIAQGKRAHTYIWYDTWGSMSIAKTTMDYFLPKIQTPKGSIVALDFEHGASSNKQANTDTILYGMRRIKQAGYTPMYYSYKPFTLQYVYYQQILA
ncbi:GH25 family lysozyme, partial [Enterococcus avium]